MGLPLSLGRAQEKGRDPLAAGWPRTRTGSQGGLFPLASWLALVSPEWIMKDGPLALSPRVGQGEEGTAALGAFSILAALPLCYLLSLDILVMPYTLATPM